MVDFLLDGNEKRLDSMNEIQPFRTRALSKQPILFYNICYSLFYDIHKNHRKYSCTTSADSSHHMIYISWDYAKICAAKMTTCNATAAVIATNNVALAFTVVIFMIFPPWTRPSGLLIAITFLYLGTGSFFCFPDEFSLWVFLIVFLVSFPYL